MSRLRPRPETIPPRKAFLRNGFTVIELLVVILVISILTGMLLSALPAVKGMALRSQTISIMRTIRQGLALGAAGTARIPDPVVHPLAATAPTREVFQHTEAILHPTPGTTVPITGEVLEVDNPEWLESAWDRIIRPSDRYLGAKSSIVDSNCLGLVGLRRDQMCILGAASALIEHRRLPKPTNGLTLAAPYEKSTTYPDALCLIRVGGMLKDLDVDSGALLTEVLALGDTFQSLKKLKGVSVVTKDDVVAKNYSLIANDRLYAVGPAQSKWAPGCYRQDGQWRSYRLRGTSLVDAWGRELLCSVGDGGSLRIVSAGRDGVFVVHPGSNGEFDGGTNADGSVLGGDDRDGRHDNVVDGGDK